jgi:hypothetical protein
VHLMRSPRLVFLRGRGNVAFSGYLLNNMDWKARTAPPNHINFWNGRHRVQAGNADVSSITLPADP